DIKMFKILYWEKIKSSCMRFYFISGDRCFQDYREKHEIIKLLNQKFSSKTEELLKMVDKQIEEKREMEKKMRALTLKNSELILEKLVSTSNEILLLEDENSTCEIVKKLFLEKKLKNRIFVGLDEDLIILASDTRDMQIFFKSLQKKLDLKGGGGRNSVVIRFKKSIKEEILDKLLKEITNYNWD
ncbi:MAG: hypothetical protein ACRC0G_10680, partial [Fusobacteriaceae bacterium]